MKRLLALLLLLSSALIASPRRIDFIHILKCGGTTIRTLLDEQLPHLNRYRHGELHHNFEGKYVRVEQMSVSPALQASILKHFPKLTEKQNLFSMHAPYWFFKAKDPNFEDSFKFTSLRDPIERVKSEYRYRKKWLKHLSYSDIPTNSLCYFLCSDPSLTGEELVADCIKNLQMLDHIIFMDDFERGVIELFEKLGKKIRRVPRTNTTQPAPISDKVLSNLIERNQWDILLYKRAKELFGK